MHNKWNFLFSIWVVHTANAMASNPVVYWPKSILRTEDERERVNDQAHTLTHSHMLYVIYIINFYFVLKTIWKMVKCPLCGDDDVDTLTSHTHYDGKYTIHFIYYSNRAAVQLKCHGARYPVYVFVFICERTWSKNGQPISMCFSKRKCYKKKRIEIGRFFMWKHFNIDFNFNIYPPQILNKIIGSFCFQSQRKRERKWNAYH